MAVFEVLFMAIWSLRLVKKSKGGVLAGKGSFEDDTSDITKVTSDELAVDRDMRK